MRKYIDCPECQRVVVVDYSSAGETREAALARHKGRGECRPRTTAEQLMLMSTHSLGLCFAVDLEFMSGAGGFDGDTVRQDLQALLRHPLPTEIAALATEGLGYIQYGCVSAEDTERLIVVVRDILEWIRRESKLPLVAF